MKKLNNKTEKEFAHLSFQPLRSLETNGKKRPPVTEGREWNLSLLVTAAQNRETISNPVEYFKEFKHVLKIDSCYYLNLLINPLDQILETCLH